MARTLPALLQNELIQLVESPLWRVFDFSAHKYHQRESSNHTTLPNQGIDINIVEGINAGHTNSNTVDANDRWIWSAVNILKILRFDILDAALTFSINSKGR